MLFCAFFDVQPKHQNGSIFVDIEGFRPCLSKPSYRAPKWALMVRLMQKERLKSPQKLLILENQAFLVILAVLAKTAIFVILASHFRDRVDKAPDVDFFAWLPVGLISAKKTTVDRSR